MLLTPGHHVYLVYEDMKMLIECHHLTEQEVRDGLELYYLTKNDPSITVLRPQYNPATDCRAGTPVEKLTCVID